MCDFLFAVWADNAMLGSKGVRGLTDKSGLMHNLREKRINRLQFKIQKSVLVSSCLRTVLSGIELSFECLNILPVVTKFHGEASDMPSECVTASHVYPFTEAPNIFGSLEGGLPRCGLRR